MTKTVAEFQAQLADREAIRDCLMRYCRGVDRCDASLLQGIYWPGAVDDHGTFTGVAEDFIEYLLPALKTMDQTQHMLGNILIDIKGSAANVDERGR